MPALALAPSLNQITSLTGRAPRISLAESLREIAPGALFAKRQFQQEQAAADLDERRIAQQERGVSLQEAALDLEARQQASQQRQQTIGNVISGASTVGTGVLAAKQLGLFGASSASLPTAAALSPATVPVGITATGAAGTAVPAAAAVPAASGGTIASNLVGAASGTVGAGVASGLAGAGLGYGAGRLVSLIPGQSAGARTGKGLGGAALGAGVGFAAGGPIGGILGGLFGGLSGGGLCIIHEAAYGRESREVAIARAFRDQMLTKAQLRAYYHIYEGVALRMRHDPRYRVQMRHALTDHLIRYGAAQLRLPYIPQRPEDREIAEAFLQHLRVVGEQLGPIMRSNGEIV